MDFLYGIHLPINTKEFKTVVQKYNFSNIYSPHMNCCIPGSPGMQPQAYRTKGIIGDKGLQQTVLPPSEL